MTVESGNFVQIFIDGTNRTQYVVEYNRVSSLCEMGDSFTLQLADTYPATLNPYQDILIKESYDGNTGNVLRGYILKINKDFTRSTYQIEGMDKSVLLDDYFIHEQIEANDEAVDYWIEYIAGLAGLSVSFQASAPNVFVEKGTLLGMQSALDSLLTLERLAAYYIRYDSQTDQLIAFRLGTSEPQITIDNEVTAVTRDLGTDKTRNVVKVYGGYTFTPGTLPFESNAIQLFAQARTEIPELLVDKTMVVANPNLKKQAYLYIVADRMLNALNSIDDVQTYSLVGFYPDVSIGNYAYINFDNFINYEGDRLITTIATTLNSSGAVTNITIGEKCPRITIQFPVPPVYATSDLDGVAISLDGGDNFTTSNAGLTTSGELHGLNIAANSYGQQMVLTQAGLYRRASQLAAWIPVPGELDDPTNDAGDIPAPTVSGISIVKVVDEPTNRDLFHLLTNGYNTLGDPRCWIYTTTNFGTSWNSKQIQGINGGFTVVGIDMESNLINGTYLLINEVVSGIGSVYYTRQIGGNLFAGYWTTSGVFNENLTTSSAVGSNNESLLYSLPNNRNVAFIVTWGNSSDHLRIIKTSDGGETWGTVFSDELSPPSGGLAKMMPPKIDPGSLGGINYSTIAWPGVSFDSPPVSGDTIYKGFCHFIRVYDDDTTDYLLSESSDLTKNAPSFPAYIGIFATTNRSSGKYSVSHSSTGENYFKSMLVAFRNDEEEAEETPTIILSFENALRARTVSISSEYESNIWNTTLVRIPSKTISGDDIFIMEDQDTGTKYWWKGGSTILSSNSYSDSSTNDITGMRHTSYNDAIDTLDEIGSDDVYYLDSDGNISTRLLDIDENPAIGWLFAFWFGNRYYWYKVVDSDVGEVRLDISSTVARTILQEFIPETDGLFSTLATNLQFDART